MIQSMGKSYETHRIKRKPIGEGFKFSVLTTAIRFIANFTPNGWTALKNDLQEYHGASKNMGKKYSTMLRSKKEHAKGIYNRMNKFCIAMDSYCILPKVIVALRAKGIRVMSTARFKQNYVRIKKKRLGAQQFPFFFFCDDHAICTFRTNTHHLYPKKMHFGYHLMTSMWRDRKVWAAIYSRSDVTNDHLIMFTE